MKNTRKFSKLILSSFLLVSLVIMSLMQVVAAGEAAAQTGSGSITIDNALKGQSYAIYKLFDATVSADGTKIAYKLPSGKTAADLTDNAWFTVDTAGNVLVKKGVTLTAEILNGEAFRTWALGFGSKVGESVPATGASVTFSGIPYGYYFVKRDTTDSVISVDSTMPNVIIKDKNESKPFIDPNDPTAGKTIVENSGNSKNTTYAIGDQVPFQFKFTALNYVTEKDTATSTITTKTITQYKIEDTPTNLKIIPDSLVVKVGDRVIEKASATNVNGWTVTFADNGKMTVVIPWVDKTPAANGKVNGTPLYNPTETVILTYKSLVMAGAAENGAKNHIDLKYTAKADPKEPTGETDPETPVDPPIKPPVNPGEPDPNDPVITTYKITLNKTDATTKAALTGAKFRLYSSQTATQDGSDEIKLVKTAEGVYRVAEKNKDGAWYEGGKEYTEVVEVEAGSNIQIKGLKGLTTYYLEETTAPDGYNRLLTRVAVETSTGQDPDKVASDATATVENNAGAELPSTGGMGRTLFYVVGYSLVIGVGIALVSRRRMRSYK